MRFQWASPPTVRSLATAIAKFHADESFKFPDSRIDGSITKDI